MPINEEELRRAVLESRFDRWIAFLRNLEQTAETDRTVVRFPNSSTYLFSTGADTFWMMDPAYSTTDADDAELEQIAALIREKIAFVAVTHLHGDHCQAELAAKLKDSAVRWVVSERFKQEFMKLCGIPESRITALSDGAAAELDGIRIAAGRGFHGEPGKAEVVSCSYEITLPDGIRLFFPGDVRDFDAEIPNGQQPVDYLFGHVFLGREDATGDRFSKLDPFCRFLTRRRSSCVILTHLYEVGRLPRDMWTHRHAKMASELLLRYDPNLKIRIPHFGDALRLLRNPDD